MASSCVRPSEKSVLTGEESTEPRSYENPNTGQVDASLWKSYFATELAALSFFHKDYTESSNVASSLDRRVAQDSIATAGQDIR
jgi:hypothetical protein